MLTSPKTTRGRRLSLGVACAFAVPASTVTALSAAAAVPANGPTSQSLAAATLTPTIRMSAGPTRVTDADGIAYAPAFGFVGGVTNTTLYAPGADITSTTSDALYYPERFGMSGWRKYVTNGTYKVTLKMREGWWHDAGKRVFSVTAEGQPVITDLDIYKVAGKNQAYDRSFTTTVADGQLTLGFTAKADLPVVSAIVMEPVQGNTTTPPTPTPTATPTITTPAPAPTTMPGPAFAITSFGARADGVTNDREAVASAIAAASRAGGGFVQIPDTKVLVQGGWMELPANVGIVGTGARSELLFTNSDPNAWRFLFRVVGDNVIIKNLRMTRSSGFAGVMIDLRASKNFTMDNVQIDGRRDSFGAEFHAILIYGDAPETISNVTVRNSLFRRVDYGLLQPSERTVTVDGFTVDSSVFELNHSTDLEFNAPNSTMRNVTITNSTMRDNKGTSPAGGFGVGLAHVTNARIQGNSFKNYGMNPVHIEDRSSGVLVANNTFTDTSLINTGFASDVFIISGSSNITVRDNVFDSRQKSAGSYVIYAGTGGSSMAPQNITISRNTTTLSPGVTFLGNFGATGVTTSDNVMN